MIGGSEKYTEMFNGEMAIIGATATDIRDILIEGKSGIMATGKPWAMPVYEPSKMRITWPTGMVGHIRSAEKPARIRGLSVGVALCDEIAHWEDPQTAWDNLKFALREGKPSHIIAATTPLPTAFVRELAMDKHTKLVTGTTFENAANLDARALEGLEGHYAGTRIGDQELRGILLDDNPNSLFRADWTRRIDPHELQGRREIIDGCVAIDPAGGTTGKVSDETGIVASAIDSYGNLYQMADASTHEGAAIWPKRAVDLAASLGLRTIVGEINFGGDMVENSVKNVPRFHELGMKFVMVTATKSKGYRAGPIAMHYEQQRAYHVGGIEMWRILELQMTGFDPTLERKKQKSPDRMDAMVHGSTYLLDRHKPARDHGQKEFDPETWDEMARALRA